MKTLVESILSSNDAGIEPLINKWKKFTGNDIDEKGAKILIDLIKKYANEDYNDQPAIWVAPGKAPSKFKKDKFLSSLKLDECEYSMGDGFYMYIENEITESHIGYVNISIQGKYDHSEDASYNVEQTEKFLKQNRIKYSVYGLGGRTGTNAQFRVYFVK